jgi:DNA-directed RNA polymerase subunit RPC12/RpoP
MEGYELLQCSKCGEKFPAVGSVPEHGPDRIRRCPKCAHRVGQQKGGTIYLDKSVRAVSRR